MKLLHFFQLSDEPTLRTAAIFIAVGSFGTEFLRSKVLFKYFKQRVAGECYN